jgi:rSAM/selenodomain-associated transferase 1
VRRQLVVLARWPIPGRCKRRLAAGIGAVRAAVVQRQLTGHTLACCRAIPLDADPPEIVLAADPLGDRAVGRWAAALGADRGVRQGPGGLGLRMARQLRRACRDGAGQVVLIGSDLPQLQPSDLAAAFRALNQAPLVLGPAHDGGYWLIGCSAQTAPELTAPLFSGMPWGTDQVLERTLAASRRLGLEPALLARRADLDHSADLTPWR